MIARLLAFSVHLFTASGAFLAFLAMLAAMRGAWVEMFAWLGLALLVDGVDGPMARKLEVRTRAARWSGVVLDMIVDYLTYVFIPAVALVTSHTMYYPLAIPAAAIIIITGAIYFADTRMKTNDASFQGFPGCWNMVVLVLFATDLTNVTGFWIILLISVTQFMPLRFVHPVRTKLWRVVTLPVCCAWVAFAGWACWAHFQQPFICTVGLMASSIYLLSVGVVQQALRLGRAD